MSSTDSRGGIVTCSRHQTDARAPRFRAAARAGVALLIGLAGALLVSPAKAGPATAVPPTVADRELAAVVERFTSDGESRNFFARMQRGELVERIPALSHEEARSDAAAARRYLDDLAKIPRARLSEDDRVTLEVLSWSLEQRRNLDTLWWYEFAVTTYTTWDLAAAFEALAANPLDRDAARAAYASLLESIAVRLATTAARLDAQRERGIRLPAPTADGATPYFEALCVRYGGLPDEARGRMATADATVREGFVGSLREIVKGRLVPECGRVVERLRLG
jgi:uncharacterized protein (DUF885 family)